MKKLIFTLLLLGAAMVSNAQFRYGLKVGANYSDLSVSTSSASVSSIKDVNAVQTWRAGFLIQYAFQNFSIQSELNYSVEGGDLLNPIQGNGSLSHPLSAPLNSLAPGTTVAYRSQNLVIPLNFQYGRDFGAVHLFALAGPYLSYLVSGTINGETSTWNTVQKAWGFNRIDLGFGAGIGAEIKKMQLTLRYDLGGSEIGKIVTNSHVTTNLNPFYDMREKNLSLSLGYLF
ncbi:MAG TPA: outer membrane beta-barrel protein [Bacteroidales bacterium]|nr:outer membrane beta-barrel protein [Bacteroidales bacterium]